MRTYGRITNPDGSKTWEEVSTTSDGHNDLVWAVTVIQTLKLNLNESPFYANYGIPAKQSVIQQLFPDFYAAQVQRQYAQYFASLIVSRVSEAAHPTYNVQITTNYGATITQEIPT